jgi:hypothetical protein
MDLIYKGGCSHHIQCDQFNFEMLLEDNNDEYDNSDEDEDSIPLAANVADENEHNRKMLALPPALPALPAAGNEKIKGESLTNKKPKKSEVRLLSFSNPSSTNTFLLLRL